MIRMVAMWGTGGIGNYQIALGYARQRWNSGASVVLWIYSETEGEVAKSFEKRQRNYNPMGIQRQTPRTKTVIYSSNGCKQQTKRLVIFDNVEDDKVLTGNQPKVGQRGVLITCRSKLLAESTAMFSMEVTTLSTQESTSLILQILDRAAVNSEEAQAAASLAKKFGGLALAIVSITKNIKASRRFNDNKEFLPYYEENRRALR
ncbi:hypothetical protein HD806DRAFT_288229 [Xylariaceae sp. AK1471]|nr:hypothetical protein HD806DRAFT_288229 [Xylariaceae sp. AK1471]